MKRFLTALAVSVLALFFCACSLTDLIGSMIEGELPLSRDDDAVSSDGETDIGGMNVSSILDGLGLGSILDGLGLDSIVSGIGLTDGLEGIVGGTGDQIGGDWPDNEFTRLVPKPAFSLLGASAGEDEFQAAFSGVNIDEIRAYAEELKAAGFTVDAETEDKETMGVKVYSYAACNADGYRVKVSFTAGVGGLSIEKP